MKYIIALLTLVPALAFSECIQGDCYNGYGVYIYDTEDIYQGEFKNGDRHGQGTYRWLDGESNGDSYKGEWRNGTFHGQGSYTSQNGEIFNGKFENGTFQGISSIEEEILIGVGEYFLIEFLWWLLI